MKIDSALKKKLKTAIVDRLREEKKTTATVETPYPMSDDQMASLKANFPQLADRTIVNKIVPELLGGFVIKFNSEVIDASINSEINKIVADIAQL